jgi:hypothetical protein
MCSQQQDRPSFQITFICTNKTKKIYGIQIYIQLCTLLTNIRFIFISSKKRWNREPLESFSGLFSSKCKYILCMYVFYFTKNVCVLCLCCNVKKSKTTEKERAETSIVPIVFNSVLCDISILYYYLVYMNQVDCYLFSMRIAKIFAYLFCTQI